MCIRRDGERLTKQSLIYATHVHLNHIARLYTVFVVQVRWYNNFILSYLIYRSLSLAVSQFPIRSVAMEFVSV